MTQMRMFNRFVCLAALVGVTVSCGDVARQGQSPVFLTIDLLQAKGGGPTSTIGSFLLSDVLTMVSSPPPCTPENRCPTIFNDVGQVTFSTALKDVTNPGAPTTNNAVTISRYRVSYRRADGRNTPGVDVPYPFDGAATVTIPGGGTATMGFEWVRHVAKEEPPLVQLQRSPSIITTLADVTFFGTDRVGNDISVTGTMQIDFGNFGDF